MTLAEILGAEDNPFSLFLILILLLGASGYFDPVAASYEDATETSAEEPVTTRPAVTLPVWQTRPSQKLIVRPFSEEPESRSRPQRSRRPGRRRPGKPPEKKDILSATFEMLGLPPPSKALSLLKKALTNRQSRHPLLMLRHKMLQ